MPSIRKRVTGFIRQLSVPTPHHSHSTAKSPRSPPPPPVGCFIQRYLDGEEERHPGLDIQSGKTGYQLPVIPLGRLEPEVFATYTGPDGGITSLSRHGQKEQVKRKDSEDLDYIDLEESRAASRRASVAEILGIYDTEPKQTNGHQRSLSMGARKVTKSPTGMIDNSVMNIRVMDRIYRVDDSPRMKLPVTDTAVTCSCGSSTPRSGTISSQDKTSEIIDVDSHLELIETEDGYIRSPSTTPVQQPCICKCSQPQRKSVTISEPGEEEDISVTRGCERPNTLDLNSQSSHSVSSSKSDKSKTKPAKQSAHNASQSQVKSSSSSKKGWTKPSQSDQRLANGGPGAPPGVTSSMKKDYPELRPSGDGETTTPTNAPLLNDSTAVQEKLNIDLRDNISVSIAGVRCWNRPNAAATGLSDTLYEKHPLTGENAGNPIADSFAVVARKNSAILVLGDGVNWGVRAALASRAAVYGAMEYLNQALFGVSRSRTLSTQDVFQMLLRSFHAAHCLILEEEGLLTTLTAAVVVPTLVDGVDKFHLCVCNVGDSLAYVYSDGHVREVTQGSHDINSNRDMRDALGALGPVDGLNPELSNLTCSLTEVFVGDIVFLTSDGVSDNFDPVVGKFCVPKKPERSSATNSKSGQNGPGSQGRKSMTDGIEGLQLPTVEAFQRHELTLLRIEDLLNQGSGSQANDMQGVGLDAGGKVGSATELCHRMLDFCQRLTTAKRKILEDPELYPDPGDGPDKVDQKMRRRRVCEKLAMVPGKLDHATITAYQVGDRTEALAGYTGDITDIGGDITPALVAGLSLTAPHASCEDLTYRESPDSCEELTPTPSVSLSSTPPGSGCGSLAATPTHRPVQDIKLCQEGQDEEL